MDSDSRPLSQGSTLRRLSSYSDRQQQTAPEQPTLAEFRYLRQLIARSTTGTVEPVPTPPRQLADMFNDAADTVTLRSPSPVAMRRREKDNDSTIHIPSEASSMYLHSRSGSDDTEFHRHLSGRRMAVSPPPVNGGKPHGFSRPREVLFVLVLVLAHLLMFAGLAQGLVPQYVIGEGLLSGRLSWYTSAYALAVGAVMLPAARLGDLFGHKNVFVMGIAWLGIWELVGGFSLKVQQAGGNGGVFFVACRVLQGVGVALFVPNGRAMLERAYHQPCKRKTIVTGLYGAAVPLGFVAGGVMASMLAMETSWPWIFWTEAVVCLVLTSVAIMVLPPTERKIRRVEDSLWRQLDGLGIVLGVSGSTLFSFAFNQAPIVSWSTPYTYFILIIGAMLIAAFVYVERKVSYPLVPIRALRSSTVLVLCSLAAGWGAFSVWAYFGFSFLEDIRAWSPLLASASVAPMVISGLAISMLVGVLLGKGVKPQVFLLVSMATFVAGSVLFATAPVDRRRWPNTVFGSLIIAIGMVMSNAAAPVIISSSLVKEHQSIAASLVFAVVNYAISLGLGIAGTIETHVNENGMDLLAGYRASQFFGVGLGGLGVIIAAVCLVQSVRRSSERDS